MQTLSNIEIFVPVRPKTVMEQLRKLVQNTNCDWILLWSEDTKLLTQIPDNFTSDYDYVSFYWEGAPAFYGRNHFESGLIRTAAVKQVLARFPNITSEGSELLFHNTLFTEYSTVFRYTHVTHLTMKSAYRYGKGRAYFNNQINSFTLPKTRLYVRYLKYYLAYAAGLVYASITKTTDNNW